ncbi:DUF2057 family protein [Vibrio sinaloensis]|nr:DUF2057 family protein [Vibrio sinaloensis]
MQIGRNYKLEIAEYNRGSGVAAVGSAAVPVTLPATMPQKKISKETTLRNRCCTFWYNKADAETKQRFKQAILAE